MSYTFRSCFSEKLQDFLQMKKALKYKYHTQRNYLNDIDRAAIRLNHNSEGITKDLADSISKLKPNESTRTRYARVSVLQDFSSYLVDLEIPSYVPHRPLYPRDVDFTAQIYSDEQISGVLKACDSLRVSKWTRSSSIACRWKHN